jgi:hypothetical protein
MSATCRFLSLAASGRAPRHAGDHGRVDPLLPQHPQDEPALLATTECENVPLGVSVYRQLCRRRLDADLVAEITGTPDEEVPNHRRDREVQLDARLLVMVAEYRSAVASQEEQRVEAIPGLVVPDLEMLARYPKRDLTGSPVVLGDRSRSRSGRRSRTVAVNS